MDYISLLCCLVAFLLYHNTLDAGFVYDDRRAILSNPDLLPTTPWFKLLQNDFWGTPLSDSGSHGSYRPLCVLSFRLNYLLGGFRPWGYHLVNVLLHCLATVLLVRVARKVLPKNGPSIGPLVSGLFFASHPIHTEAVAGIVGRADLAACNLYLLAFLTFISHVNYRDSSCCSKNEDLLKKYNKFVVNWNSVSSGSWSRRFGKDIYGRNTIQNSDICCWKKSYKTWGTLLLCVLLSIAAMLSKETGITVLGVCVVYDMVYTSNLNKKQWRSGVILGTTAALLILARIQGPRPQFSTADNPTAKDISLATRFMTFVYLPVFNMWLLLYPNGLSFDWGMDAIPRIVSIGDVRNLHSLLFYSSLGLFVRYCVRYILIQQKVKSFVEEKMRLCPCTVCDYSLSELHSSSCRTKNNNNSVHSTCNCWRVPLRNMRRNSKTRHRNENGTTLVMAVAFLTLPFLPATNLLFYVGFVVAERVLYLPSAGLCILVGLGATCVFNNRKCRNLVSICVVLTLLAFSVRTVVRNKDWTNEESLYRSAISFNPPKAYGNLGSILSSQGRISEAEWAFRKALLYRPNMADVHYNLGVLLQGKHQLNEAILSFQRAIHFRPSLALAYVNLGAALIAAGRCQEAVSVLRQGSRLDGTGLKDRREHDTARVSALLQLGALYSDQGRLQRALATYREAAHSLPDHYPPQSVFNILGETLARLQQDEEAERWYQAALNAQPDHVPAHITYGKLLAKNVSRVAEAEHWFRRAQRLAPGDPSVYHHYGEFLVSKGRYKEAAGLYEKAAELRPQDYELAAAAATAMRQAGRQVDAERWYRKAVSIKPSDARGHTNLGAILHLNGKYREAADSYREALRLQPNDVTTLTNLHRLHSVMT